MTGGEPALELAVGRRVLRFPAVWLRDNCPCAECLDPSSGQKLKDITDIPNGLVVVAAAEDTGQSVVVTYGPDRHRSVFSRSWLAGHALDSCGGDGRVEDDKDLWLPADLDLSQLEGSWPRYLADPADRARRLDAVLRCLPRGDPVSPGGRPPRSRGGCPRNPPGPGSLGPSVPACGTAR